MQFTIRELLYVEITADIAKFMTNVFGEMIAKRNGYLCFNTGWSTEDILATLVISMKFRDCYKVLI
jgi:hypothetical protein